MKKLSLDKIKIAKLSKEEALNIKAGDEGNFSWTDTNPICANRIDLIDDMPSIQNFY